MKKLILVTLALMFTAITAQASGGGICPLSSDRNTKTTVSKVKDILGGNTKPSSK
jgi:hypothetical protein